MSSNKTKLIIFGERTTIHGIPDFINSLNIIGKLFWGTVLLAAFIGAGYEIYQVINRYMTSPFVTIFEIIPVNKLEFPTIKFCPSHVLNASKIVEYGVHPVIIPYAFSGLTDSWRIFTSTMTESLTENTGPYSTDPIGYLIATSATEEEAMIKVKEALKDLGQEATEANILGIYLSKRAELDRIYEEFMESQGLGGENRTYTRTENGIDVEDFVSKVAIDAKKLIVKCQFMIAEFDCHQYIQSVFDIRFGRCFVMKMTDYAQVNPGIGISFFIDLNIESAFKGVPGTTDGLYLDVAQEYNPTEWKYLMTPVGSQTLLSLKAIKYRFKTSNQVKNCIHVFPETVITSYPESSSSCRAECVYQRVNRTCGCTTIIPKQFLKDKNVGICAKKSELKCLYSSTFGINYLEDPLTVACFDQCKPACETWEYDTLLSYSDFPSNQLVQAYEKYGNSDVQRWKNNTIILDISFQDIQYISIRQEESATIDQLGSQIGGYLGLFAGVSLISIIQAVVICLFGDCVKQNGSGDGIEGIGYPRMNTSHSIFSTEHIKYDIPDYDLFTPPPPQ